jgi:hypothetical protein
MEDSNEKSDTYLTDDQLGYHMSNVLGYDRMLEKMVR